MLAYQAGTNDAGSLAVVLAGATADSFAHGASSPIVTSDGVAGGSALVWVVWSADKTNANAELRAYGAVPSAGILQPLFSAPVGTSVRWALPGISDGVVYVATYDRVLAFGVPAP
jgi:hypothetical protein